MTTKGTTAFDYQVAFHHDEKQANITIGNAIKLEPSLLITEVHHPENRFTENTVIQKIDIQSEHETLYQGRGVITNVVNTDLSDIVTTILVDTWSIPNGVTVDSLSDEFRTFLKKTEHTIDGIQSEYRLVVSKIKQFLQGISQWLEQAELKQKINNAFDPETWAESINKDIQLTLIKLFQEFEHTAQHIKDDEVAVHKKFAQQELLPFILNSAFAHRCYFKPLGYAGDYEMVNMILNESNIGSNTISRLINIHSLLLPPAAAHRNRVKWLNECISETIEITTKHNRKCKILNIGCGPAAEIQELIKNHPHADQCDIHLLDFNQDTLNYIRDKLANIVADTHRLPDIQFILKSVRELLKESNNVPNNLVNSQYDLIYCAGLFDYLSDKVCSKLMDLFFMLVKPEGYILATNVHSNNPSRYYMEHILDWHLIYRNENDMQKLGQNIGENSISTDSTGVNVFLKAKKIQLKLDELGLSLNNREVLNVEDA